MARLNEPPMSSDSLESLRRKMLRQNRDLAKSNNVRALRIRELENECACMLSENLELRGRILDLEKQVEDSETRRIADHALAIKAKLEAQLTEWGTLLAGLGLEPPIKQHSPRIKSTNKQRLSFSSSRPSPSQRRLRDVARDIEELGHIAENKTHPRMSLNPEQILALRSEADSSESIESPDLGPPPVSQFIDADPVKVDSPARATPTKPTANATVVAIKSPIALSSPRSPVKTEKPSPVKQEEPSPVREEKDVPKEVPVQHTSKPTKPCTPVPIPVPVAQAGKAGSKRKLAAREEPQGLRSSNLNNENQAPKERISIRDKADGKTLKELTQLRKEAKARPIVAGRKPLAAKSTNNDMNSPQKAVKPIDKPEISPIKADLKPIKTSSEASKPKPVQVDTPAEVAPRRSSAVPCELGAPVVEPVLLSPCSPEPAAAVDGARGDTPPPADITSEGETSRPSRRNRTAISYAEPNLRDKMRRPTKELFDAVAGEGKYSRRSSQSAPLTTDMARVKRESDVGELLQQIPSVDDQATTEPDTMPVSPLANKSTSPETLSKPVTIDKPKRLSTATRASRDKSAEEVKETELEGKDTGSADTTGEDGEIDPYEFTSSSPQPEKHEDVNERRRSVTRSSRSSRRFSTIEGDGTTATQERTSSRRRSMML